MQCGCGCAVVGVKKEKERRDNYRPPDEPNNLVG